MYYRYRKLTPEEQTAIEQERRARGYPLHGPPHPYRYSGFYLLTAANYEHAPIMDSIERRTDFEAHLHHTLTELHAELFAWVILPNHYHVLVGIDTFDQVSAAMQRLHGRTSREWNLADGLTGKRRVWYQYSDRRIRNDQHFFRALNYIHYNPVHHRYADTAYDWPWSSVHNYLHAHGREWLRHQWQTHHPGDFGQGWDDHA
jgi:putative transposase